MSTKKRLCETLNDLSSEELEEFKPHIELEKGFPLFSRKQLKQTNTQDIVELMMDTYSRQYLGLTIYVLKLMNRTDLVQRLIDTSPGTKEKHRPSLMQRVETMESVIELLLETLKDLTKAELKEFKSTLCQVYHKGHSSVKLVQQKPKYIPFSLINIADMQGTVCLMVQYYGQQSVEMTKESLKMMNRTDLVQRLSDSSSRPKKELSVDEHQSALIKKAATMRAVKELLLETLNDLSYEEQKNFKWFLQFTFFQRSLPQIHWSRLLKGDMTESLVDVMVEKCGQKSVKVTREVLMDMNRTDLVQRLSETSSGLKEKLSVDEHQSALTNKAATMGAVEDLLLEAFYDLTYEEQKTFTLFLQFTFFQRSLPQIPWTILQKGDMTEPLVDVMVKTCGEKSVEVTREVLMDMNRTDLVQRLSETSSGLEAAAGSSGEVFGVNTTEKEKHSVEEDWPALIQKVESMESVIELLLETLKYLSVAELKELKGALLSQPEFYRHFSSNRLKLLLTAHVRDTVLLMVQNCGEKCVEMTKDILKTMKRTDLVQRLSDRSSGSKKKHSADEQRSALIHKVATIAAVPQLLLETLNNLSYKECGEFKKILPMIVSKKNFPHISSMWSHGADRADIVNQMVHTYGQQSVELTREVFMDMKRTDLVQRLSKPSSGLKDKHSVDEHLSELMQKGATITTDRERLLKVLANLKQEEFKEFKWFLQDSDILTGLPLIPHHRLEKGNMLDLVDLMLQTYSQQSVELTKKVLMNMKRTDLVQRLSKPSSGLKGPSRSLEHVDFGSAMQDSSDWTKLEPEVNSTDADEAPTYSLQSEAGNFECSVSGLRWVCKEKVSFKYQFCSWEEPMERMEMISYMPAGPPMNITVTAGKLDEAYLPHWICIDNNPEIRDKFAVLHIDDCGVVVEKVAEVTSSHVKLSEPHFSQLMVLVESGCSVDIYCYMLIYKTNKAFLTLDVYLIPCHPGLQKKLDDRHSKCQKIEKPHPVPPLRMNDYFILTAGVDGEEIDPEKLMLRYDENPNFFEVYIENANTDFKLMLRREKESEPVRICKIRKGDYQSAAHVQDKHSVDEHLSELMQKEATITTDRERLLNALEQLKQEEFEKFKWFLRDSDFLTGLPHIPPHRLEEGNRFIVVDLMLQTYSQQSVELTKKVFQKIPRNDLVQKL